ncbi:thioredoxin fold domain-containing protein [Thiorhodococcus mannitoliphagus]|uniref:Thioredoxin fold domain-containing protein n=1 Tax=Thiorhodococcus mannitoliphagus TaxID=329406 RepID=A0A6P1DWQ2_9GAMM|nr:thioredoxin fold domain-containing protein [Thiorhodococcus mannitoliphagus]NEX20552.1 thioredoxin fold domain-containing protein [Thiorhodococcus mannitoliphagus]
MQGTRCRHSLLVFVLWLAGLGLSLAGDFEDATIMHIDYPDWFKETFLDLPDEIDEARSAGKVGLMVLFTTEGCSYCAEFIRTSLADARLAERVQARFDAIGLEIFSDAEMVAPDGSQLRVKEFAERAGAGFAPSLVFYGEDGALLYRGVGYHSPERFASVLDYLSGPQQAGQSFRDFVVARSAEHSSAPADYRLLSDPLFSPPPFALDRSRMPADRPLLVLFEADGCEACGQMHKEVLARPEVRELLGRFEVVRLDAEDDETPVLTPGGRRTTAAAWFAQTGLTRLPALLFFEEHGQEVLRTDALVLRQRMMNALMYTLERAYQKGWTYQRFARTKSLERSQRDNGQD